MFGYYCGIDFGTSNSSVAIASPVHQPFLIEVEDNQTAIPSSIFYASEGSLPCFGNEAVNAYVQGREGRFMRSLKRVLGTDLMSSGTTINTKSVRFDNILTQFIKHLRNKAIQAANTEISDVVMGRPVHFRDNDEKADDKAEKELEGIARQAGFKNIVFQYEPIAAAYAHEAVLEEEKLACVVDIGGGTSDFTIIRIGANLRHKIDRSDDILASGGVRIGGNDFDKNLCLEAFMPLLGMNTIYGPKNLLVPTSQYFELAEWSKVNTAYSYQNRQTVAKVLAESHQPLLYKRLHEVLCQELGHRLLNQTENTKINLSFQNKLLETLSFLADTPQTTITRQQFEDAIQHLGQKINNGINDCLKKAEIKASQVELLILTGGSTEIPYLQQKIRAIFPKASVSEQNKLASVGLGLAYDSLRRF